MTDLQVLYTQLYCCSVCAKSALTSNDYLLSKLKSICDCELDDYEYYANIICDIPQGKIIRNII